MRKIIFLTTFIVFNLGFSDLQSTIRSHYGLTPQYEIITGYKYLKRNNQKSTFFRRSLGYEKGMIGVNTQASYQRLKSEYCNAVNEIVKVDKGIVPGTIFNNDPNKIEPLAGCYYKGTYWNNANSQYKAKQFYNSEIDRYYKSSKQNNSSYLNLGIVYINQGKYREATKVFLEGAKNKDVASMIALGTFSLAAKDFSSAKKYYKMAADLGNEEALEIYNRLVLAGY